MRNQLVDLIETENLLIKNASMIECSKLQDICSAWTTRSSLEGLDFDEDYIYKCLTEGDLPPTDDSSAYNYYLKSIYLKGTKQLIGFFDIYLGYPTNDTLWLSVFLLDKAMQNKGYGKEAVSGLINATSQTDFKQIAFAVHLKNWKALHFWIKAGFNKILDIYGDKVLRENTFALITLAYTII